MIIVIRGIKKSLPCTKVLGFEVCIFTSKVLGVGASDHYWVDLNTIIYYKRYDISSDVSEKQSIVYKSACIESAIIDQYHFDKNLNA